MTRVISWVKQEVVLVAALSLAAISALWITPTKAYIDYVDYRVLVLLWCLMLVVGGLRSLGVFAQLGGVLCGKVRNLRELRLVLVCLCFFSSMLITNDVALITFVPFTISVYTMLGKQQGKGLISLIVWETIAANLGSMLTPIGNPQNLLLFSLSRMSVAAFIRYMLPLTLAAFVLILVGVILGEREPIPAIPGHTQTEEKEAHQSWKTGRFWIYLALFAVCMGNVFHLYSHWIVLLVVAVVIGICNRSLFREADYALLLTFIGFFIFIGNMRQIDAINQWILGMIEGNELVAGILTSQVISNVPAAMLLSGFTTDYRALLYGVNVGGLGTLIASMASLISYRFYVKAFPAQKGAYFKHFTICNILLLILLTGVAFACK